jgi:hypothetical protein
MDELIEAQSRGATELEVPRGSSFFFNNNLLIGLLEKAFQNPDCELVSEEFAL